MRINMLIIIIRMSFKINLDTIFGSSSTQDPNNNSCYESQQSSQSGSNSSYLNRYKIKVPIFDQQPSPLPTPKPNINTNVKSPFSKASSVISVQTQFSDRAPGQRLYYQSKNNVTRKIQQMERIKLQRVIKQQQQATFKPKINKNSQKILQYRAKYPQKNKKKVEEIVPTHIKKQQQQIIKCTFKPQLIAKSTSGLLRPKQKDQVFQQLFNDHKVKQVKKKLRTQQNNFNEKNKKKLSKAEFDNFLTRNSEFINKVQKKNELIVATSHKFDLQTGHKLFSPRTNTFKSHKNYFTNKTDEKFKEQTVLQNKNQIQPKPIFAKNYANYNEQQGQKFSTNKNDLFSKNNYENEQEISLAFNKINEAKQDQQQQIGDQFVQYQTVKGFHIQSQQQNQHQQNTPQHQQYSYSHKSRKQSQNNSLGNSRKNNIKQQEQYERNFENQSPVRDEQQKNSDEGQTHHEGEQSRCNDQQ